MIFTIQNDEPRITIEGVNIPEFKEVWLSEDDREGRLSFIYHYCQSHHNMKNTYYNLPPDQKEEVIKSDYIKDENWKKEDDELVLKAIDKYMSLIPTASSRVLQAAEVTAHRLAEYFENVDFNKTKFDKEGNEIDYYDPKKVVDTLRNLGGVIKTIQDLRTQVAKEWSSSKIKRKGSQTLSMFDQ